MPGYSGIYVGWVGYRNLGDEAMFAVCRQRFSQSRWRPFNAISHSLNVKAVVSRNGHDSRHLRAVLIDEFRTKRRTRAYAEKISHELSSIFTKEVGLFGGGTLLNRNQLTLDEYTAVRKRTRSPLPIFGSGVASPRFWSREPGWTDRRKEWASLLNELPSVGVRGPYSKALLEEAGVKNVKVCGDPAIAFHRAFKDKEKKLPDRRLRIAINTGDCSGKSWGDAEHIQDCLVILARQLANDCHDVSLIPVWPRDVGVCIDLARRAGLPQQSVLPVQDAPESFLTTIESFDLIVALKLHAAILAAAANVPFVLLEYQPKAMDFAASIGLEEFTVRTDLVSSNGLIEMVNRLITELPQTRAKICQNMCTMLETFDDYCSELDRLIFA